MSKDIGPCEVQHCTNKTRYDRGVVKVCAKHDEMYSGYIDAGRAVRLLPPIRRRKRKKK